MRIKVLMATVAAALVASQAAAQAPSPVGEPPLSAPKDSEEARQRAQATMAIPDPVGTGAYPAVKEVNSDLPSHVVYRPRDLGAIRASQLGVIVWGNGGCGDNGAEVRFHLLELASRGYVVIAPGKVLTGPGSPTQAPQPAPAPTGPRPPRTTPENVKAGLDWILAEGARRESPFFGKINPQWVAASGWSCGGMQAMRLAADTRIKTLVLHNTGIPVGAPSTMTGTPVDKSLLATFRTPVIYILGGETDIAHANGLDDFNRIDKVPVVLADLSVGHGGTFFHPNGGRAAKVAAAWLDWQLRGDLLSQAMFVGPNCGLCAHPEWKLQRKGLDTEVRAPPPPGARR